MESFGGKKKKPDTFDAIERLARVVFAAGALSMADGAGQELAQKQHPPAVSSEQSITAHPEKSSNSHVFSVTANDRAALSIEAKYGATPVSTHIEDRRVGVHDDSSLFLKKPDGDTTTSENEPSTQNGRDITIHPRKSIGQHEPAASETK